MIIQLALEVILEAWMNDRIQLKDVGCSGTERWLQGMTERVHIPRRQNMAKPITESATESTILSRSYRSYPLDILDIFGG